MSRAVDEGAGAAPASASSPLRIHATTVVMPRQSKSRSPGAAGAMEDPGLIILGPSGSGKSALALQLMAAGAMLVADDYTCIVLRDGRLIATAPDATRGMIEARGVGLLGADSVPEAVLALAVDLGQYEHARLPPHRVWGALGVEVPLLHAVESAHFPAAIMLYLRHGRKDQP